MKEKEETKETNGKEDTGDGQEKGECYGGIFFFFYSNTLTISPFPFYYLAK